MFLENDESVEFDHADLGRHELEAALENLIVYHLPSERLELARDPPDWRIIGQASLAIFELSNMVVGEPPLRGGLAEIYRLALDSKHLDEPEILADRRAADQQDMIINAVALRAIVRNLRLQGIHRSHSLLLACC
jgi:hypothetical protein